MPATPDFTPRAQAIRVFGLAQGFFSSQRYERTQPPLKLVGAIEESLRHLAAARLARVHELGQLAQGPRDERAHSITLGTISDESSC